MPMTDRVPYGPWLTWSRVAWIVFCLTCIQSTFQHPVIVFVPGFRVNLFTGLLCFLAFGAALLSQERRFVRFTRREIGISGVLVVLALLSGILSEASWSSSARSLVLIGSGLGGFWCARILLQGEDRQRWFRDMCFVLFAGLVGVSLLGYVVAGKVDYFVDPTFHPLTNRLVMLSFAPLCFLLGGSLRMKVLSLAGFVLCLLVFFFSGSRSALVIPVLVLFVALGMRVIRLRYLLVILIAFMVLIPSFVQRLPETHRSVWAEPAYYRAESYPFGWRMIKAHPVFGIGLRAPREKYLEGYEITYPYVTREQYASSVRRIETFDNVFLTFATDLGVPFCILYTGSLVVLVCRLGRLARLPFLGGVLPAAALFFPLVAAIIKFLSYDGLLMPQVCWFFHVLLGLIPSPEDGCYDKGNRFS